MHPDPLTVKFRRAFGLLDVDGNGRIDRDDLDLVARRVAGLLGHPPGSEAAQELVERYEKIWSENLLPMDTPGLGALTRDHFVSSLRDFVAHGRDAVESVARTVAVPFLEAADTDRDGRISPSEFRAYARGYLPSLTDAEVDNAFAGLDRDRDGELSFEEVVAATVDFWTNTDPIPPGSWWWG